MAGTMLPSATRDGGEPTAGKTTPSVFCPARKEAPRKRERNPESPLEGVESVEELWKEAGGLTTIRITTQRITESKSDI